MLKIGFITPSSEYLHDPFRGDQHCQFYLLTRLEDQFGDKVDLSLIDLRGIKKEFALYHIPECDVYLHSVYTTDFNEQASLVKSLKDIYKRSKHIAGGPHVNVCEEECRKAFDSIVLGDADENIIKIINDVMNSDLKGIYRQESEVDINIYPYGNRKYLPKSSIARKKMLTLRKKLGYDELIGTTAVFSRGCPYKCAFCAVPQTRKYNPGMRLRNAKNIEAEIEYLKREYGIQGINLLDEIGIPLTRKEAISRLEAIARTGIKWRGQCRVDGINAEIAKLASESGCIALGLGIESAWQQSLDIINKRTTIGKARETISNLKNNDIETRMYLILGLPGEPENIVDLTWDFIKETAPDVVFLHLFTIRPGTEVFDNPERFGIKYIDKDWSKNNHLFGRYGEETPTITFEYDEGRGFTKEQLIGNYMELQKRLRECGLSCL